MQARTLEQVLAYLADLGQRHQDVKTSCVALAGAFPELSAEQYPAVFVEADPMFRQFNEGADEYQVAIHFLTREARTDESRGPALVSQMKQLSDEYGQQLLREKQVQLRGEASGVVLLGTGDGLASGVRWEVGLLIEKPINRATNPNNFTPLP